MTAAPKPAAAASRLQDNRAAIDEVDSQILALVNRRADLAREIGEIKRAAASKQFDHPAREAEVARRARAAAKSFAPAHAEAISARLSPLVSPSKSRAAARFWGRSAPTVTRRCKNDSDTASKPSPRRTFPRFSAKSKAAAAIWPWRLSKTRAKAASAPFSTNSSLPRSRSAARFMFASAIIFWPPPMRAWTNRARVFASASLAQCRRWLAARLPEAEHLPCASNAAAAAQAAREPRAAAVAPLAAAEIYGLRPLAADIEDSAANTTRFFIVADRFRGSFRRRQDLSFCHDRQRRGGGEAPDARPFARRAVSMTRLESRPARGKCGNIFFSVDIVGHRREENIAAALAEVKRARRF